MSDGSVLVIDDDPLVRRFLRAALAGNGLPVVESGTVAAALDAYARTKPAIVLLDLGLPDGDGLAVLSAIRRGGAKVPVIVLSARGQEGDKIAALDAGADDYLTKPFGVGELLARIRVAMRHAAASGTETPDILIAGPIKIDQPRHEVAVDGKVVHLTPIEFKLLVELARQPGRVLTHRQLLRDVWGPDAVEQSHYLRVHIAALRRKIEQNPNRPQWLVTEMGVGYRLRDRRDDQSST